jgi:23S rRNA (adenine2030-N6)-methyltransferase
VFDTHAGAGAYRLDDASARRSGEAQAGVARLMAAGSPPPALAALATAVARFNGDGPARCYPGSPPLALSALGPRDRYLGCEVQPDDYATLVNTLRPFGTRAAVMKLDGYAAAARHLATDAARTLLLIDPPFERADDYARTAELVAARPRPDRQPALVWTPLKDLETFDAFLGRLEAARPRRLVALEVRLRPLDDPMRLNGCAMVMVDGPDIFDAALSAGRWVADHLGEDGRGARLIDLSDRG